jgi:hypothetical protein
MPTTSTARAETRSISIAAPPESVLALVADPRRLPEWAPAFARAVEPDGEHWRVDGGAAPFRIAVRVSHEHGTVDLVRPGDPTVGARTRVVPIHGGSAYLFTIVFPPGVDDEAIAQQMATVETELETVRALCEDR